MVIYSWWIWGIHRYSGMWPLNTAKAPTMHCILLINRVLALMNEVQRKRDARRLWGENKSESLKGKRTEDWNDWQWRHLQLKMKYSLLASKHRGYYTMNKRIRKWSGLVGRYEWSRVILHISDYTLLLFFCVCAVIYDLSALKHQLTLTKWARLNK